MNPEFVRNLWSELSSHRLIAMPAVLGLVIAVAWMGGSADAASWIAQTAVAVLLIFWGARLAADSVLGEVMDRTWDSQRMSSISPWAMTWGKLFGGTVYVWYGAVSCLVLSAIAGTVFAVSDGAPYRSQFDGSLTERLLAAGLLAQSLAMFLALLLLRGQPRRLRLRTTMIQAVAIAAALPFALGPSFILGFPHFGAGIWWYGMPVAPGHFLLTTSLIFCAWAIFGSYRLMRLELKCRTGFAGWLCFVLFLPAYVAGIDVSAAGWDRLTSADQALDRWSVAFLITLGLTYIAAFAEPKGIVRLRRWLHDLGEGSHRSAATTTPSWAISGVVCLGCAVVTIALSMFAGSNTPTPAVFILSLLLFAVRDLALLYALTLDSRRQRGHLAALVYLAVLYGLIPAFLGGAGAESLIPAFLPTPGSDPAMSTLPVAAQALAAYALVATKWRRLLRRSDVGQPVAAT